MIDFQNIMEWFGFGLSERECYFFMSSLKTKYKIKHGKI